MSARWALGSTEHSRHLRSSASSVTFTAGVRRGADAGQDGDAAGQSICGRQRAHFDVEHRAGLGLRVVALAFVLLHVITWFNLASEGDGAPGRRLQSRSVATAHFTA
jgi:hypothetical protein